VGTIPSNLC